MLKYVAKQGNTEAQFKVGFAYENIYSKPNYIEAFKWYSMAAESSHREAIYHLGLLYEKGLGVSQDYQRAIQFYNQAHQLGIHDALYRLGVLYHHGKGVQVDMVKALEYYSLSAENGNPEYQCELGKLYQEEELVQKDPLQSLKWYTKAYLQGYTRIRSNLYAICDDKPYEDFFWIKLFHLLSTVSHKHLCLEIYETDVPYGSSDNYNNINNRIGALYLYGLGTEIDLKQAWNYFSKEYSVRPRSVISHVRFLLYDTFSPRQKNDMLKEFEEDDLFINQATIEQLYLLGMIRYDGVIEKQVIEDSTQDTNPGGKKKLYFSINDQDQDQDQVDPIPYILIEQDYLKAFTYLKKAADKSYPEALFQLGIIYHCGYGVEKNSKQGDTYFDLVPHIHTDLKINIAMLYHTHSDIQCFPNAFEWYHKIEKMLAEDLTISDDMRKSVNEQIQTGLGLLYEYGDGVEQDYQKALECYKKLSEEKFNIGYLRLGLMHYYGKGVSIDYKQAWDLLQLARHHSGPADRLPYIYYTNGLQSTDNSQKETVCCTMTQKSLVGEAYYHSALMCRHGQSVIKSEFRALGGFSISLSNGCKRAKNEIISYE